jgi:hypothetical protein
MQNSAIIAKSDQKLPPDQCDLPRLSEAAIAMCTCKIAEMVFIRCSAASFEVYAVGPWVSVAWREAALARGNPAKELQI